GAGDRIGYGAITGGSVRHANQHYREHSALVLLRGRADLSVLRHAPNPIPPRYLWRGPGDRDSANAGFASGSPGTGCTADAFGIPPSPGPAPHSSRTSWAYSAS